MSILLRWAQSNAGFWTITLLLAVSYLAFYRPIKHRAEGLDLPLAQSWQQLKEANQRSLSPDRLDLDPISRGLNSLLGDKNLDANQTLLSRIAMDPDYQKRSASPFQLLDFQNERQSLIEKIKAEAGSIQIAESVFENFPKHLSEQTSPQYLWAELALTHHLIQSMIFAKISSIQSLSTQRQPLPIGDSLPPLVPFFLEMEFECQSTSLSQMLLMLPSQSDEIHKSLGHDYPPFKPSLYVDQILIQKASAQDPALVEVWIRVIGFIQTSPLTIEKKERKQK